MVQVTKRNGAAEAFDITKIAKALKSVYEEVGEAYSYMKCLDQAHYLTSLYHDLKEVDIEAIQDDVELYLMEIGEYKAAKAYISYRKERDVKRNNPWEDLDERQEIILSKYTIEDESKKEFLERISFGNEKLEKIFRNKEALWGGRNLFAIGRPGNITGSNCYVAKDPQDNMEDIYRAAYDIARTYSYGGGQGMNLSSLRPKGAKVNNSSNTTPGVMTFAELYSFITLNTQQESRRGALMLVLDDSHPDIIDFVTSKLDIKKINGANISVSVSDAFMTAVKNDDYWEMNFETSHEKITKKVKAKELMNLIAYANHTVGDPGFLLIDNVNSYHLLSEYEEVHFNSTNPCGEQPLMPDGSCNLGSINLKAFFKDGSFDMDRFKEVVYQMTWGLDDLLTSLGDRHALPAQIEHVSEWREVGLGVMGLADLALASYKGYGDEEFNEMVDEIMDAMANYAAQASALRAKEMGVFPKYDFEKISSSKFYKDVYWPETKAMIEKYGLRNSRLLSIAPTGSISNVLGVSGGVEPFFMLGYYRTIKSVFEEERKIFVWEKTPLELAKKLGIKDVEELPKWAKITSQNIEFTKRAKVQATIQKYVDTAISSTFNVPNSATLQDIIDIYMEAWRLGLKGATVFRDNCAKIGILTNKETSEVDSNPAEPISIEVHETIENKKDLSIKHFVNVLEVSLGATKNNKIEKEACPMCGAHLVKRGGCTKCSNNECVYEKCSI